MDLACLRRARHHYLRVSLTDRCNLRCQYCMPDESEDHTALTDVAYTREVGIRPKPSQRQKLIPQSGDHGGPRFGEEALR